MVTVSTKVDLRWRDLMGEDTTRRWMLIGRSLVARHGIDVEYDCVNRLDAMDGRGTVHQAPGPGTVADYLPFHGWNGSE